MAGNDTRQTRYYAFFEGSGKSRIPVSEGMDEATIIRRAERLRAVNVTRETGPTSKPTIVTIWRSTTTELGDVDAVLAALIKSEDERATFHGVEAVAVRAIVELSRAGRLRHNPVVQAALMTKARELMADLIAARQS